ncbi:uncharacterized protein ACO6RY_08262 [Pungitius sinensis]
MKEALTHSAKIDKATRDPQEAHRGTGPVAALTQTQGKLLGRTDPPLPESHPRGIWKSNITEHLPPIK